MTTKRGLITDSFKVLKKTRRGGKRKKSPTPPPALQGEAALRLNDSGLLSGISRMQRWERAKLHGLNPPEEIKELLLQTLDDPEYSMSLWREYPF
ncbi:DNA polymerase delta subunit 4 [Poecilia reticulata]|uniref:DNA polymerase delta subunit 4 n=1 Tax=Poecilia reticulata TaxID=8081 RepID=UPI0004A2ACAC|nr:PREDICTED: DNA polymerase delta subunit 4 [Poecilia reticulata]